LDYAATRSYASTETLIADSGFAEDQRFYLTVLGGDAKQETEENIENDGERQTFRREIITVKQETDTRAVVEARLYNTTPLPAGIEMDTYDTKRRRDGIPVRYILEKDAQGWKIVQAKTTLLDDGEGEWKNYFTPGRKFVPTYVRP
jgi:hypothetical protein